MPIAGALRSWEVASVVFFAYAIAAAVALSGLPVRRRMQALGAAAAGLGITAASIATGDRPLLHQWILPPVFLLLAYWTSGRLFVGPMPSMEARLLRIDRALDVRRLAGRTPRAVAELLEAAYAGVYPVIPIAFAIYLLRTPAPDPDRFWTVILVTDYICFGLLPWVQTRPPRAIEPEPPWRSRFRFVNLRLLGATSIQVNTFPSGHAAEAVAAALLVAAGPWPYAAAMLCAALAISAGAVGGRYHYSADALLGWVVALAVWTIA